MTLSAVVVLACCFFVGVTSTPQQRIFAAEVIKRAVELSREKQGSIAREMGMDEGQLTRALYGAGRLDFASLMSCCPSFLRGLSQAIGEVAGVDPAAERLAVAVADRVAARLTDVHPRMVRATLAAQEEVA